MITGVVDIPDLFLFVWLSQGHDDLTDISFQLWTLVPEFWPESLKLKEFILTEESEVKATLAQSCPTLRPRGLKPPRLLCPWDSPGKNTGVGCHFLPDPGTEPGSPTLQADSLLSESLEKPTLTGVSRKVIIHIRKLELMTLRIRIPLFGYTSICLKKRWKKERLSDTFTYRSVGIGTVEE